MRKIKKHEERENEILDAAERLFFSKGYAATTVNDILRSVNIAKGTFYHYFKSKEEVMHDIILRYIERNAEIVSEIVENPSFTAMEKLRTICMGNYPLTEKQREMTRIQKADNSQMHMKILTGAVQKFTPILAKIIEQGVKEGVFHTEYPLESMELIMLLYQFIFAGELFIMTQEETVAKAKAHASFMERILGTPDGSLDFMYKIYEKSSKR